MTRILLTNDDGVDAPGLLALRSALLARGLRVTTIAPDGNRSCSSRAVTPRGPVAVRTLEEGEAPVHACDGTPVDCVRIGLLSTLAGAPALVVSGINRGINMGDDITYSGTVGAALEAGLLGACGIAFSQQGDDHGIGLTERGTHRFLLAPVAAAIAAVAAAAPGGGGSVLNVNLPAQIDPAAPVVLARPGRRRYAPGWLEPYPERGADGALLYAPFAGLAGDPPQTEVGEDVDFGAVLAGRVAVTPLLLDGRLAPPPWVARLVVDDDVRATIAAAPAEVRRADSAPA